MGINKFANFRLFGSALNFAVSYQEAGAHVAAPIKLNGLWVVKYNLPTTKKV